RLFVSLQSKKQGSSAILNNLDDDSVLLVAPLEVKELKKGELVRVISVPKI
ncbi:MAG: molybdopterin molybdenumtransferase MoeA, partial [Campylobacter sp.]|nr:molybdopterin molybdenumtransferase MoeA [Campylobacter sp.]